MFLTNGKLEDIEDAVKEEESVKCFLTFRDRNIENTLAKGQNLIGLEFLSCGRRELYRLRPTQCLLRLASRVCWSEMRGLCTNVDGIWRSDFEGAGPSATG
jgi:hypothetical protein